MYGPVGTDVVRKIVNTGGDLEEDRLLLWTGEKIASLRFKTEPEWVWEVGSEGLEGEGVSGDAGRRGEGKQKQAVYEHLMRRALERQADEVRWMGRLGLG